MDKQSPSIKVVIRGQEISHSIVNGGSGVNVINKMTCDRLGITCWEDCMFFIRMADTSPVRPLGLIQQLELSIGGHMF